MARQVLDAQSTTTDIQFVNIAYRPEPKGAATGGPNGVLKVLRDMVGPQYRGFYSRYVFEPPSLPLPSTIEFFNKEHELGTMSKKLLEAEYFVVNHLYSKLPPQFTKKA
ncbi:MAG: hypothetical protein QNJ16_11755 [Rhodobacter sp.]|nr:hypothetical protein [Rhodobacter sp.]